jgi:hypothetical protein
MKVNSYLIPHTKEIDHRPKNPNGQKAHEKVLNSLVTMEA